MSPSKGLCKFTSDLTVCFKRLYSSWDPWFVYLTEKKINSYLLTIAKSLQHLQFQRKEIVF